MWKVIRGMLDNARVIVANASLSNFLSVLLESFTKVKMLLQFASNGCDTAAHQIGSQVLDSVASSIQDMKTRENLMEI